MKKHIYYNFTHKCNTPQNNEFEVAKCISLVIKETHTDVTEEGSFKMDSLRDLSEILRLESDVQPMKLVDSDILFYKNRVVRCLTYAENYMITEKSNYTSIWDYINHMNDFFGIKELCVFKMSHTKITCVM